MRPLSRRAACALLAAAAAPAGAAAAAPRFAAAAPPNNTELVYDHVRDAANTTFRPARGALPFPYQVPGSVYEQLWDWDALFLGVATLQFGSLPYFIGSMSNFAAAINLTSGEVKGCLTPDGATPTLYHAKPILIQGAYLAGRAAGNLSQFAGYDTAYAAVLAYWDSPQRYDPATGLRFWHDQLESGCDNLVLSQCPSDLSPECWVEAADAFTLAAPDLQTFMYREWAAYALLHEGWAAEAAAAGAPDAPARAARAAAVRATATAKMGAIKTAVNTYLWHWEDEAAGSGWFAAWNRTTRSQILNRTFQMAVRAGRWGCGVGDTGAGTACEPTPALIVLQSDPASSPCPARSGRCGRTWRPTRRRWRRRWRR